MLVVVPITKYEHVKFNEADIQFAKTVMLFNYDAYL